MKLVSKILMGSLFATSILSGMSSCKKKDDVVESTQKLSEVTKLVALGENESVKLTWEKPSGSYSAYSLSYSPDGVPQEISKDSSSFTINNLVNGSLYTFTLKVKGSAGVISNGVEASAIPSNGTAVKEDRYVGDVELYSQADVDAFDSKYTYIDGKLVISGPDIDDLSALSNIDSVAMNLEIYFCETLKSLNGLENLKSIGATLYIRGNDDLLEINGLSGLTNITKDLSILDNGVLPNLDGLLNVTAIRNVYIGIEAWKEPAKERRNTLLTDYCGIKPMLENISGEYYVENNGLNPTKNEVITNCN